MKAAGPRLDFGPAWPGDFLANGQLAGAKSGFLYLGPVDKTVLYLGSPSFHLA
jgi:hypothetical protein